MYPSSPGPLQTICNPAIKQQTPAQFFRCYAVLCNPHSLPAFLFANTSKEYHVLTVFLMSLETDIGAPGVAGLALEIIEFLEKLHENRPVPE